MRDISIQFEVSRSALSRHKQEHLVRQIAALEVVEQRRALRHAENLIALADGLQAQAIALFNAAAERGDEVAAAAWFDRTLKASSFRLDVQQARCNERDTPSAFDAKLEQHARVSKIAERFLQLWSGEKEVAGAVQSKQLQPVARE